MVERLLCLRVKRLQVLGRRIDEEILKPLGRGGRGGGEGKKEDEGKC